MSIIVTDQGNGGASCGKCGHDFGTFLGSSTCSGCGRKIVSQNTYINMGGSDF